MLAFVLSMIALAFLVLIYVAAKRQGDKQDELFDKIREKSKGISTIGKIDFVELDIENSITESDYLSLEKVVYIFKYSENENYWINFVLKNITTQNLTFEIEKVTVSLDGNMITCDKTLLLEKVPEHYGRPYGNAYFDVKNRPFILGANWLTYFIFYSRFDKGFYSIKEDDYLSVEVTINKRNPESSTFELLETVQFKDYFKNIKSKNIDLIEGDIKWED